MLGSKFQHLICIIVIIFDKSILLIQQMIWLDFDLTVDIPTVTRIF